MMKKFLIPLIAILLYTEGSSQIFEMKKSYTGYHRSVSRFNTTLINQFVVQFNRMWTNDIESGFAQYDGGELGQNFTTSGLRFIWGKKDRKWTASTDYAFGGGKDKNEVKFKNGIVQHLDLRTRNHQINASFGVTFKENKYWVEGLYSTNLGKIILEYSTEHLNGVTSYGTEYKLNGVYIGYIKTMELGMQTSMKYKKYVFYTRAMFPVAVIGPDKAERNFVDAASSQVDPRNFPSNYDSYVNDAQGHISRNEGLNTEGFKGFSIGFGMFYLIGKEK